MLTQSLESYICVLTLTKSLESSPLPRLQLPVLTQTAVHEEATVFGGAGGADAVSPREEAACYLSQEQALQLWIQIQQVRSHTVVCVMSNLFIYMF